jgi:hypothetical protein
VLPAIDLDDQPPVPTDEIDNVRTDCELPMKLLTGQPTAAQLRPQQRLGARLISAQSARSHGQ